MIELCLFEIQNIVQNALIDIARSEWNAQHIYNNAAKCYLAQLHTMKGSI